MKTYRLLGPDGHYGSTTPGTLGGNGKARIYGRLDCPSALSAIKRGWPYQAQRVFFADEEAAVASGYRPCGNCMKAQYRAWKAETAP
jgi:methylphosphotriester-DNA--protein-cysteine methyltransferase